MCSSWSFQRTPSVLVDFGGHNQRHVDFWRRICDRMSLCCSRIEESVIDDGKILWSSQDIGILYILFSKAFLASYPSNIYSGNFLLEGDT